LLDIVLADGGFDTAGFRQAHQHIPAFIRGKDQLIAIKMEQTRHIMWKGNRPGATEVYHSAEHNSYSLCELQAPRRYFFN